VRRNLSDRVQDLSAVEDEPANNEVYYQNLIDELRVAEDVPVVSAPNHPVTSVDEVNVGDQIGFSSNAGLTEFKLCQVERIIDSVVYARLFVPVEVPAAERHVGVDRAPTNERTTPSWELAPAESEESYVEVELKTILVIGDLLTHKKKLKTNSEKAMKKFLQDLRSLRDAQRTAQAAAAQ